MNTARQVLAQARSFASLVKLSHSVFALPFAVLSMLLAADGRPTARQVALVVLAVVAARTAAMAYNRWADRDVDGRNPRTGTREIPRGEVSPAAALWLAAASGAVFLVTCRLLAPICLWLGVPTLAWLLGYSHSKRFSSLCHLWLGIALGLSPVAAWVAVDGELGARLIAPAVLGVAVAAWVAGFDVLYACQDEEFDRTHGLFSIPARLGIVRALWCSRALHVAAVIGFAAFGAVAGLGWAFRCGVLATAVLLVWEHSLLRARDLSRIGMAFFTANGMISLVLLTAGCLDLYAFGGAS